MEKDPNPIPKINILPTYREVGHFILHLFRHLPDEPIAPSEHFKTIEQVTVDQTLEDWQKQDLLHDLNIEEE